ncbi:hypothetical protein M9Y10_017919 [Tritrichomonas musculus]|uniref:Uncharacterized protein n=1 Tax=Tritrichomonas musculus TaxID=1915356 RepID=A0ABR2HVX2_9EUKA
MKSESTKLYDFILKWKPENGKNHKIDFDCLLEDVPDPDKTHYYLNLDNINVNPIAIAKRNNFVPRLYSLQIEKKRYSNEYYFLSDRVFIKILFKDPSEQLENNFQLDYISINTFYLDEIPLQTAIDKARQIYFKDNTPNLIPFHQSDTLVPFLLNNDSLLIYSSGSIKSSDVNESNESFVNLSLFEFKQYDIKINITIGRDVFEQIVFNNVFSKNSSNLLQFTYRQEGDKEIINESIMNHIFKQIIPDPLSSDRFFFIAYKKLYLALIVGDGQERNLEIFQYFSDTPILKCAISETSIVYCRTNQEGKFIFEAVKRTDDVFATNIIRMKEIIYPSLPYSFFIFNEAVYINSDDLLPCIWNLHGNKVKQAPQNSSFHPISNYYLVTISNNINNNANSNDDEINEGILTVENNMMEDIVDKAQYFDDYFMLGNSTDFVFFRQNDINIVNSAPKEKEANKTLFSIKECKNSINAALDDDNKLINPIKSILDQTNAIYDKIQKITEKLNHQFNL